MDGMVDQRRYIVPAYSAFYSDQKKEREQRKP